MTTTAPTSAPSALLTQVIGRAGCRFRLAVIQTNNPENDVIKQAVAQDYEHF